MKRHAWLLLLVLVACASPLSVYANASPLGVRSLVASSLKQTKPVLRQGGWLFQYADVRPYTTSSPEAKAFIATNACFTIAGAALATSGEPGSLALGALTELAGVASVGYHAAQCHYGGTQRPVVQFCMLIDYAFALPTMAGGLAYAIALGDALPMNAVVCSLLAVASLVGGWLFESPRSYMILHGLWHVFGAAAAWELGMVRAVG
jgi:hypothetical protein